MQQPEIENIDSLFDGMKLATNDIPPLEGATDYDGAERVVEENQNPFDDSLLDTVSTVETLESAIADSLGDDSEIDFSPSEEILDVDDLSEGFTAGRAFPDALDGTPQSHTSKTVADEQAEARIEHPMQSKLEGGDHADILKNCSDGIETILQYEKDRGEVNAEIAAVREKLHALGISKKALAMAISYSKMNVDQRDGFDLAYKILRKAIGQPVKQMDMFESGLFSDS